MVIRNAPWLAVVVLSLVFGCFAPPACGEDELKLPENPAAWINSPPLTKEMLAGKAVYLYYFEEGCPTCRAQWPALLAEAQKFSGKPVVFIGVNSGSPRNEVQEYVRDVGVPWPVIVDADRSLEKQSDVGEISLQNIYQAKMLLPDGKLADAATSNIENSVERGLTTAKWRVDPAEIPESLKPVWFQVELGNFAAAAPAIKGAVSSPKLDTKAAGTKLQAAVLAELQKELDAAKQELDAGRKWNAYRSYAVLSSRFRGYELPSDVMTTVRTLSTDDAIRNEIAAGKQWEAIQKALAAPTPPSRTAITGQITRLVAQYTDTEAAKSAQAALDRLGTTP